MRAVVYSETGGPEVLRLVERPVPEPGPGEVRVAVRVSGVNPTDWKARRGSSSGAQLAFPEVVPNQDGSGTIDAVGDDVDAARVGERVWLWEAAWQRADGTAHRQHIGGKTRVAQYRYQDVIEVVGDASRQHAHAFQLLRLPQALLHALGFLDAAFEHRQLPQ